MKPLYKWAGGKTKLINKHYASMLSNIEFDTYIEPFFGGGAMFCWAYNKNPEANFVINDINSDIINIYLAIKNDYALFLTGLNSYQETYLVKDKPSRKEYYYQMRAYHAQEYDNLSLTARASLLYFLMQTSFNGIWQINKNTNGKFGTPSGLLNEKTQVYNKENLDCWHEALQKTKIFSGDYSHVANEITKDSFVFLDPPYRGCFTNYGTKSDDQFQKEILTWVDQQSLNAKYIWLANRDLQDDFFSAYQDSLYTFDITYTAGRRKRNKDDSGETFYTAKKATEILLTKGTYYEN